VTASTLHLTYLASAILFAVVIAVPTAAHRAGATNGVVALLLCLPGHATTGSLLRRLDGCTSCAGGLKWGRGTVSVGLTIVIFGFVAYLSITRLDVTQEPARRLTAAGSGDPAPYNPQP
jgi:uncharacterized membrane-anchored protein